MLSESHAEFDHLIIHPTVQQTAGMSLSIESNSQPITGADCSLVPNIVFDPSQKGALMPCKGNPNEFCGGPDIIAIYTLPGTGLVPILPFDPTFDGFCGDCLGHT